MATKQGVERLRHLRALVLHAQESVLQDLTEADRATLRRLVQRSALGLDHST